MPDMTVRLVKTATGYATVDGRYQVTPKIIGDGPRNKGHKEWRVTDTVTGDHRLAYRLYNAREWIAGHRLRNH
jgi:hypothetical protein